jgi:hypothetical protein
VERVIRTIKERIAKFLTLRKTKVFYPYLQDFARNYNNSPHRALPNNMTPSQVNTKNELQVWQHLYSKIVRRAPGFDKRPKLKVGQHVKLSSFPFTFRKSTDTTFSRENFVITQVLDTTPTTYILADLKNAEPIVGAVYREELQPVQP